MNLWDLEYCLEIMVEPRRKTPTLRSTPLTQPTFEKRDINENEGVDLNVRVHCNRALGYLWCIMKSLVLTRLGALQHSYLTC